MANWLKTRGGLANLKVGRVVFVRLPILNKTKTRLAYFLGPEVALKIYEVLLRQQNEYFLYFENERVCGKNFVYVHPEKLWLWQVRKIFSSYFHFKASYVYQKGFSLGQKLFHCAKEVLKRYERVVIWGADIPTLEESHFRNSWLVHPKNYIVPTQDGGYALVAISRQNFHQNVFENILWGGRKVFFEQIRNFERYGLAYEVGEKVVDIDYPQDILRYLVRVEEIPGDSFWSNFLG